MSSSPPAKIRFGILSTANIGKKVSAAIFNSDHGQIVAVASRSLKNAQVFKEAIAPGNSQIATYGSYEELLHDAHVDAVYIPLPSALKRDWAIAAARAGKHVLAEKPFTSSQEINDIITACRENHVFFMDNTMFLHHPRTKELAHILARGDLGPLSFVHTDFHFSMKKDAADIRLDPTLEPLGALGDLGWYNAKFTLVTSKFELPVKVLAAHVEFFNGIVYTLSAVLVFKDGRKATFNCGFETSISQPARVGGSERVLTIDDFVLPWASEPLIFPKVPQSSVSVYKIRDGNALAEVHQVDTGKRNQETRLIDEFCGFVAKKKANKHDVSGNRWGDEALATQKILDALLESARTGGFVEIH